MSIPCTAKAGKQPPPEIVAYELHGNCYLNITWHCTLRCAFCPKYHGEWVVQGYDLRLLREPEVDEIIHAIGDPTPYPQIVFCGLGEPTLRLDTLLEVARQLKAKHPATRIRINTDGLANLVYETDVTPRLGGLIDELSISMNAQNETVYKQHCRPKREGAFEAMLDFAVLANKHVATVNLTAIDGLEGVDIAACEKLCRQRGLIFRRRVLDIVG
ncbi:Radical SAM domain protein [hydrothermal vent metagenome]|uniref:Radical SAM domain protein n=1 Tax=hydrothermal vent metagenome TaxID=652676 RepID=A0A3B1BCD4_9ZZZZ